MNNIKRDLFPIVMLMLGVTFMGWMVHHTYHFNLMLDSIHTQVMVASEATSQAPRGRGYVRTER